jgi:hypothetical protein
VAVAKRGDGGRWWRRPVAVRRRGRRHLTGQWINKSGGGGEVRIRISGYRGGEVPVRLEGGGVAGMPP